MTTTTYMPTPLPDDAANARLRHEIERHTAQLSEHADSVVIIVTRGSRAFRALAGNRYACAASTFEVSGDFDRQLDAPAPDDGEAWATGRLS